MTFVYDPSEAAVVLTTFSAILLMHETVIKNKNLRQISHAEI